MCGRFTLTAPADVIAAFFDLASIPDLAPRYNIAPTQQVAVVRCEQANNHRRLDLMHWGLIPFWARDRSIGSRMINARSETLSSKPSFRSSFASRRCLVVADGFYEWQRVEGQSRKQPHYIRMRGAGVFGFAGLWASWRDDQDTELKSCTIITTEPNDLIRTIHNRMPVILEPADYEHWLDPGVEGANLPERFFAPYPPAEMEATAVGTIVNSPSHDGPECIDPI